MEEWKQIPGYEGLYEASNLGRIRTIAGKTTSNARYAKRVWKQRVLKSKFSRRKAEGMPDERVSLWKDGEEKTVLVSRLVALAWCEGYEDGMTVNHKDGNTLNNCSSNLEWVSLNGNINHAFDHCMYSTQKPCTLVSESGEETWYRSQAKASKSIGRSESYIANCIRNNRIIYSINGERYGLV